MTHLLKLQKDFPQALERISPEVASDLLNRVAAGELNLNMAKEVLDEVAAKGSAVADIIQAKGFKQVSDTGTLEKIIDEILEKNPDNVAAYRGGKDKLFGFFVGQAMKALQGKANPQVLNQLLKKKLNN